MSLIFTQIIREVTKHSFHFVSYFFEMRSSVWTDTPALQHQLISRNYHIVKNTRGGMQLFGQLYLPMLSLWGVLRQQGQFGILQSLIMEKYQCSYIVSWIFVNFPTVQTYMESGHPFGFSILYPVWNKFNRDSGLKLKSIVSIFPNNPAGFKSLPDPRVRHGAQRVQFPEQDTKTPDIRLGRVDLVLETLGGHPLDGQLARPDLGVGLVHVHVSRHPKI